MINLNFRSWGNWGKWKHVEFVEDCTKHDHYEILKRENYTTGMFQYKKILKKI